jgi:hypothetical protein
MQEDSQILKISHRPCSRYCCILYCACLFMMPNNVDESHHYKDQSRHNWSRIGTFCDTVSVIHLILQSQGGEHDESTILRPLEHGLS